MATAAYVYLAHLQVLRPLAGGSDVPIGPAAPVGPVFTLEDGATVLTLEDGTTALTP